MIIILLLSLPADIMSVSAAKRFSVTDGVLTVYGEPERINALGKLHWGDEYEIVGQDGSMYIFMYNGRKAYAASYCCKLIEDAEVANKTASAKNIQKDVYAVESEPECDVEHEEIEIPADAKTEKVGVSNTSMVAETAVSGNGSRSFRDTAEGMKGLLGFLVAIGIIAGLWSLFGSSSFNRLFDNLAGQYVSDCSKWMYFRPAIAVAIFGITGNLSDNVGLALAVTAVYEVVLICSRTKKLYSFRAAVVEAFYLLFSDMGLLLLFWMFLIFAFFASGGSSSSSNASSGNGANKDRNGDFGSDCRDCDHYPGSPWCVGTPMAGYRCSHYQNVTGPK